MDISREKAIKYYKLARFTADTFSKDPSTKVGCILLKPESLQVLSIGYNGMARGIDEKVPARWERPTKYLWIEHSERNCLYNACRSGTCTDNSIAVVTMFPCTDCCRALIQSGVKTIVSPVPDFENKNWGESFKISEEMLQEAKVQVVLLNDAEVL